MEVSKLEVSKEWTDQESTLVQVLKVLLEHPTWMRDTNVKRLCGWVFPYLKMPPFSSNTMQLWFARRIRDGYFRRDAISTRRCNIYINWASPKWPTYVKELYAPERVKARLREIDNRIVANDPTKQVTNDGTLIDKPTATEETVAESQEPVDDSIEQQNEDPAPANDEPTEQKDRLYQANEGAMATPSVGIAKVSPDGKQIQIVININL